MRRIAGYKGGMFTVDAGGLGQVVERNSYLERDAMTIIVDIRPEVQAALARQAAAHGRALEAYAASLLEDAAEVAAETSRAGFPMGEKSRVAKASNLMELFEPIRGLLTDEEVDTLFSRNPSAGRPVDLA